MASPLRKKQLFPSMLLPEDALLPTSPKPPEPPLTTRRRRARAALAALALALAALVVVVASPRPRAFFHRRSRNVLGSMTYGFDQSMVGRDGVLDPSPRCCTGVDCLLPMGDAGCPRGWGARPGEGLGEGLGEMGMGAGLAAGPGGQGAGLGAGLGGLGELGESLYLRQAALRLTDMVAKLQAEVSARSRAQAAARAPDAASAPGAGAEAAADDDLVEAAALSLGRVSAGASSRRPDAPPASLPRDSASSARPHLFSSALAPAPPAGSKGLLGAAERQGQGSASPSPSSSSSAALFLPASRRRPQAAPGASSDASPLADLECTLHRSNPLVPLVVMLVPGELDAAARAEAGAIADEVEEVPALDFANSYEPRYGRNWLKLRAWNLTRYDAVALVDADAMVVGPLDGLWGLPTDFAAVWDQSRGPLSGKTKLESINGGVLFLRPCPAVAAHMLELVATRPKLRFARSTAEQAFLAWYNRYTGWTLPIEYNAMASQSLARENNGTTTVGGAQPIVVHFSGASKAAFQGGLGSHLLCSDEELRESAAKRAERRRRVEMHKA